MAPWIVMQLCVLLLACLSMCAGHGGHGHGHQAPPGGSTAPPPTDFHDPKITQDEAHLKEHLKDEIGKSDKPMTPQEMEFHYFRLHDTNNDTRLDGLEILAALTHMDTFPLEVPPQEAENKTPEQLEAMKKKRANAAMLYYTDIIDRVLLNDDLNKDGYLTYTEFAVARRRDEARYNQQAMEHQQMQAMQQQQVQMQQQQQQQMQFQQWQQYQQFLAQQQQKPGEGGTQQPQQAQQPPQIQQQQLKS